jgi:hypothetical protein
MVPVRDIIAAHPGLVQKLRRFTFPEAAQLAASLSLLPDLHAQTIRIEMLQHLVASCAEGKRTPERDDLAEWTGKYLTDSPFARYEDPVEDVFVGSANSPFGSFRLLMGVVADADFWIERLLVFLAEKEEFQPFEAALAQVIPLLKLSDQLVDRLGFERYRAGGSVRAAKIPVPRWRDLQPPFNALVFSSADLAGMGVARSDLDDFVLKEEHRGALVGENMWHSMLERHPLLECGDGHRIVAAQPYPLLFATFSGAHLYGFPSPDSDFDPLGAHVLPLSSPRLSHRMVRGEPAGRDESCENGGFALLFLHA